jgi:hypothetical protein
MYLFDLFLIYIAYSIYCDILFEKKRHIKNREVVHKTLLGVEKIGRLFFLNCSASFFKL